MTDKQIECALSQCGWSTDKYTRCKNCPYNDGSPCITNLHLDTLKYIERLKANALPFKIGDKAYVLYDIEGVPTIIEREIVGIKKLEDEDGYYMCAIVSGNKRDEIGTADWYFLMEYYNKEWWTDKAIAEQELKKLIGE